MKILVVDDNQINLNAAAAQLAGHDLILVDDYEKAQYLINGSPWSKTEKESFDAVLVDLLMPATGLGSVSDDNPLVGREMPVGVFLALLAIKNNVKYVAVFTDSNHHDHPASTCFDAINNYSSSPRPITIGKSYLAMCNYTNWIGLFSKENLKIGISYEEQNRMTVEEKQEKLVSAKNWFKLLDHLIWSVEQLDKSSNNL